MPSGMARGMGQESSVGSGGGRGLVNDSYGVQQATQRGCF